MRPLRMIPTLLSGLALFTVLAPSPGLSQLIQIRPGYVRAPFVRVYTDAYGGSHVRAPFVSVSTPGYYPRPYFAPRVRNRYAPNNSAPPSAYAPVRAGSVAPTPAIGRATGTERQDLDLTTLDWWSLRQTVSAGATRLGQQIPTASEQDRWGKFLKTGELVALMTDAADEIPQADERERLREILANYDAASSAQPAPRVTTLEGFEQVRAALTELLSPPVDRQRRSLLAAAEALNKQLGRLRVGSGWSDYLRIQLRDPDSRITESIVNGKNQWPGSPQMERDMLAQILSRFENVLDNPDYQVIARLSAFQPAYQQLARYLELTDDSAGDLALESSEDVELLPAPKSAAETPAEATPADVAPEEPTADEPIPAEPTVSPVSLIRPLPGEPTPADPSSK